MSTLIIGDVHGCSKELRRLVAMSQPTSVVLVGDLFTKGPSPRGVWRQIRDGGFRAVCGNHDQRLLDYLDGKRPSDVGAAECVRKLNKEDGKWEDWLRALPLFLKLDDGFVVVHAGLHPTGKLKKTTRKMAQTMRRWPMKESTADFWYHQYTGKRRVIFEREGHDAGVSRGRVRIEREGATMVSRFRFRVCLWR